MFKKIFYLLLLICIFTSSTAFIFAKDSTKPTYYESVVISSGDTIYDIATKYNTSNMDTYKYIDLIADFNLIDRDKIYIGDTLIIPIYPIS